MGDAASCVQEKGVGRATALSGAATKKCGSSCAKLKPARARLTERGVHDGVAASRRAVQELGAVPCPHGSDEHPAQILGTKELGCATEHTEL